jgi:hypothetical protein
LFQISYFFLQQVDLVLVKKSFIIRYLIIVNNKSKDEILKQIESLAIEMIDGSYDYLLRMPIYSLTKEMFEKLKEDFGSKKEEISIS